MARERSPERDKAKQMWLESGGTMKLKDIAAALSIGETQVRKWKSQDKWAADLNSNVTNESNSNVTKRKGAPKGNKNAVGNKGGAPKGNQNAKGNRGGKGGPHGNKKAVKTGEHESIWFDTLDEDEKELLDEIDTDPIAQADESITLLTIRERRMLKRIKRLTEGLTEKQRRVLQQLRTVKEAIPVHDERSGQTKTVVSSRDELVVSEIEETSYRAIEDIIRIEEALTRVQAQKIKAVELKNRLMDEERQVRIEKLKFELQMLRGGEADDTRDDGFIEALKGRAAEVWADGTPEA
ncbi:phage terminase small subunit [Paenibacillus sp. SYP-B4298]|uniref:phage terminase small subunit n=1 Tax=Paenibacillus sp. SYP-B4298 TaxID=2996034 RepID=UPI0022DE0DB0|nr:phage terminase small subunit [Paenibacillus sp. SYP-B4298]